MCALFKRYLSGNPTYQALRIEPNGGVRFLEIGMSTEKVNARIKAIVE
jgi:hypothetical protein